MTRAGIQAAVDRFVSAWESQDIDVLLDCYAPEATITSPMFRHVRGPDAIEAQFQDVFRTFANFRITLREAIIDASPPRATLLITSRSIHRGSIFGFPPTGQAIETSIVFVLHFDEEGRIVSDRRLYDFTALLIKLGVLKAKTA